MQGSARALPCKRNVPGKPSSMNCRWCKDKWIGRPGRLWCRDMGAGFRMQGVGLRVQGAGFRIRGLGYVV